MNGRERFDDALDAAIDAMRGGAPASDVLAAHPLHREELELLLGVVSRAVRADGGVAAPAGVDSFSRVRAALRSQRMAAAGLPASGARTNGPWWARRWTLASLTLPAAAFLFVALAGASGVAAATLAVTNPDAAAKAASAVTPEWAQRVLPKSLGGEATEHSSGERGATPEAGGEDSGSDRGAGGAQGGAGGQSGQSGQNDVTLSGDVSDVHGNTFVLTTSDGEWKVQIDAKTEVSGEIVEGATATVEGTTTGPKMLHADGVDASGGDPEPGRSEGHDKTPPGQGRRNGPGGSDGTAEPPVDETPSPNNGNGNGNGNGGGGSTGPPGLTRTPPGQGNGQGGASNGANSGAGGNGTPKANNGNGGGNKKP